jgi:hypothetical protein
MSHRHFPPEQHRVQRLVDRFNADEALWRRLDARRRLRRLRRKDLSEEQLHELDLRDFAQSKPPVDCIGEPLPA